MTPTGRGAVPSRAGRAGAARVRPARYAERRAAGKALRELVPREEHARWKAPRDRHDPVQLVIESSKGRIPDLVPIRYGRMAVSPFTFYRGTALNMAADLAGTPNTGLRVQVCGDCHLMNFGGFATPERRVIFDINDFDETLPGPWEWDVKRLAASFVHAGRSNGFGAADQRDAVLRLRALVPGADGGVRRNAGAGCLVRPHRHGRGPGSRFPTPRPSRGCESVLPSRRHAPSSKATSRRWSEARTAGSSSRTIRRSSTTTRSSTCRSSRGTSSGFAATGRRSDDRRVLLDRYRVEDLALKVVGVGSVGTFCAVLLLMAEDDDPLFLQVKEARSSVLEPYVGKSVYREPWTARRGRTAPDAVGERPLPGLDGGQGASGTSTFASCAT